MPASKYKFSEQNACDHRIVDADNGEVVGELRVKPSSILWKGKGRHEYRSVGLDVFAEWINENGKAVSK